MTGASDGIGREIAVCLAKKGIHLVLVARRGIELEKLAAALNHQHGVETRVLAVDLGQQASVDAVVDATNNLNIGLLVACAGFRTSGPCIAADVATELDMVDVNCRAVLALSLVFGRRFAAQGRGGLVLMSSLLAFQGVPLASNYAATKAYVQSLAEGLHRELAPLGVDVLASAPGPTHSAFAARANMRMSLGQRPTDVAQSTLDALGRRATARPGWLSKALEASLVCLPRGVRARILGRVMKTMTDHQRQAADIGREPLENISCPSSV